MSNVLFLATKDYANVSYLLAKSLKSIGINAAALKVYRQLCILQKVKPFSER